MFAPFNDLYICCACPGGILSCVTKQCCSCVDKTECCCCLQEGVCGCVGIHTCCKGTHQLCCLVSHCAIPCDAEVPCGCGFCNHVCCGDAIHGKTEKAGPVAGF